MDWHTAKALLEWQVEMGATEAIGDAPVDRFAPAATAPSAPAPSPAPADAPAAPPAPGVGEQDAVAAALAAAEAASDLAGLEAALAAFTFCDLRRGARSTVFAAGRPDARVMVVGEAPDRDEDRSGSPFAGAVEPLFDRMFATIGLAREAPDAEAALYLTTAFPWRLPSRGPNPEEVAMLTPFLRRHVELAAPDVVVCMGNLPCEMLLGRRSVARARGTWHEVAGRPALAVYHPATLMRRPEAKREAWADLLTLRTRLRGTS